MYFVVLDKDGTVVSEKTWLCVPPPSELTIASGVITVGRHSFYRVDTESDGATDDLDTINGGRVGQIVVFSSVTAARDVTFKDMTGNLQLAGDFTLSVVADRIVLIYDSHLTQWYELSRSDNA